MKKTIIAVLLLFTSLVFADTLRIHTINGTIEIDLATVRHIKFDSFVNSTASNQIISKIPISFLRNYPNPFNPDTNISFKLESQQPALVELNIYNIKGQLVKTLVNKKLNKGYYSYNWKGKNKFNKPVSTGVYFYKLKVNNQQKVKKMLLVK